MDQVDELPQGLGVEIHVGQRGEQGPDHQTADILRQMCLPVGDTGQADQGPGEPVLEPGCLRCLAAHAGPPSAAGTVRRLLTLKTKHLLFHGVAPPLKSRK